MAFETGTASGHLDLLEKLRVFLTSALPVGQRWTVLKDSTEGLDRVLYFEAPGLAGTEQIYSVVYAYKSVGSDHYNIGIRGAAGHLPSDPYTNQPGGSPPVHLLLWNSNITYWFVGNGQRVIVVAKVSTVYQHAYIGRLIPYASPSEYPYPLFIGGSHPAQATRWSSTDVYHKAYWSPAGSVSNQSSSLIREPSGSWVWFRNYSTGSDTGLDSSLNKVWPWTSFDAIGPLFGTTTDQLLMPAVLMSDFGGGNVYGELDGVYFVSGFNNASENLINIDGVDYLVAQNIFRTGRNQYAAIKLQ